MKKVNRKVTKQNGAALIIFAIILSLVFIVFTFKSLNAKQLEASRNDVTANALYQAKSALLGWSVLRGTTGQPGMPGQLPCPEDTSLIGTVNEGSALANCNSAQPVVGWLPWRTLGLGNIRDGNGDKLWYVLSSGFRTSPINSTNMGQINLDANPNSAIVLIFSPGLVLIGQNRPTPSATLAPSISDYLDLTNSDGDSLFSSRGPAQTFNDRLIAVTQAELFQLVERRMLRVVRGDNTQGLVRFYNLHANYPFADVDDDGIADNLQLVGTPTNQDADADNPESLFFDTAMKNILVNNNWMMVINYQITPNRQNVTMTAPNNLIPFTLMP